MNDIPNHMKFGYEAMVEKEAIRMRLISEGITETHQLLCAVEAEYIKAHANDMTYRERCEARNAAMVKQPAWASLFTQEERDHLVEHFGQANDPVVVGILAKLT